MRWITDSWYQSPDPLSMKLEFLITTVSAIHDSLSNILDSKNKDSRFQKQKISGFFYICQRTDVHIPPNYDDSWVQISQDYENN